MSGTVDARVPCIGCGAMNPPGSDLCAGCGHRFAGPNPGSPAPRMAPEPAGPGREPESTAVRIVATIGSVVAVLSIGVVSLISLVIGVAITCSIDTKGEHILLDLGAGVVLAVLVAVGLSLYFLAGTGRRKTPDAKENP